MMLTEPQTDSYDVWQEFCMVMVEKGNEEYPFFSMNIFLDL